MSDDTAVMEQGYYEEAMQPQTFTEETQAIGFDQQEAQAPDEIARLSMPRYLFSAFERIYVGDRVTGMIVHRDEQGEVVKVRDWKNQLVTHYVTRTHIEPCALNVLVNVPRRVSKDKGMTGALMPGASIFEKNGPLPHQVGSGEYGQPGPYQQVGASILRANASLRVEMKYAEWIVKELEDTYMERGVADLTALIGLDADLAEAAFKIVLPQITLTSDPHLPGERIPHLPSVIHYLNTQSPKNITSIVKKKETRRITEELLHQLLALCRTGLTFASASITERSKMINDAKNARPGVSDYGDPHRRAFLARGEAIPTETFGARAPVVQSDPELAAAAKQMARVAERMEKAETKSNAKVDKLEAEVDKLEAEVNELKAGIQKLLAGQKQKPETTATAE